MRKRLDSIKEGYSEKLYKFLDRLLQPKEEKRLNLEELINMPSGKALVERKNQYY